MNPFRSTQLFTLLFAACLLLSGCVTPLQATWPKPVLAYWHAATPAQAKARVNEWVKSQPGRTWSYAGLTGSMLPYIHGGPREMLLFDAYTGQLVHPGQVLRHKRLIQGRPDEHTDTVLHMVVEVSADGRFVLLDGTNTKQSDGWQPVDRTSAILRWVVTLPAEGTR